MRPRQQLLVGLNIQEQHQIPQIGADGVDLLGRNPDERVGFGVQHGGEGIKDEARMVDGDLKRVGDDLRVDSLS